MQIHVAMYKKKHEAGGGDKSEDKRGNIFKCIQLIEMT